MLSIWSCSKFCLLLKIEKFSSVPETAKDDFLYRKQHQGCDQDITYASPFRHSTFKKKKKEEEKKKEPRETHTSRKKPCKPLRDFSRENITFK